MTAAEWITKRREKAERFCTSFGDTEGVGGVVAIVAEDLPLALDALEAVLDRARKIVDEHGDRVYQDNAFAVGAHAAVVAILDDLNAALGENEKVNAPASGAEKRTTPCSAVKPGHHCKRFDPHGDSHVWVVTTKEER